MAYTRITDIIAPSSAQAGERVSVTIQIQNLWSGSVLVAAVGVCEGKRFIDWVTYRISAGATHSFAGYFTMPDKNVTIWAYSYYEGIDPATGMSSWYEDDRKSKDISFKIAPAVIEFLASKVVTLKPVAEPVVGVDRIKFTVQATLPPKIDLPYEKTAYVFTATFISPELKEPMKLTVPVGQEVGYLPMTYSAGYLTGDIWPIHLVSPVLVNYVPSLITGKIVAKLYSAWLDYQAIKEFIREVEVAATVSPGTVIKVDLSAVPPPEEAVIELLDSKVITLKPVAVAVIELLDSKVITLSPLITPEPPIEEAVIELLDSKVVTLSPVALPPEEEAVIELLDSKVITLSPLILPPEEEEEKKFPVGAALLIGGGALALLAAASGKPKHTT